jgi:hypothetical protein
MTALRILGESLILWPWFALGMLVLAAAIVWAIK